MRFILTVSFVLFFNLFSFGQEVEAALKAIHQFPNVRDFTMTSNGDEAYITVQSPLGEVSALVRLKLVNGDWAEPSIVPFSGKYKDLEPALSADDLKLFFVSDRPLNPAIDSLKDFDIWYAARKSISDPWGQPINLGKPINTPYNEFYPSLAANNNLYFTSDHPDSKGKDDIFYSKWNGTKYLQPQSLSDSINTPGYEYNAFIDKQEQYILFGGYNRADGLGSGDIYISFKGENQEWKKAFNLGARVNSKQMDYCPFVDHKTNLLYFTSKRSQYPSGRTINSTKELLDEVNKEKNGLSKIYKTQFKPMDFKPE